MAQPKSVKLNSVVILATKDPHVVSVASLIFMNRDWEILIIKSSLRLIETVLDKDIGLLVLDYELEEDNDSNIRLISIIKTTRPRLPIIVLAPDYSC